MIKLIAATTADGFIAKSKDDRSFDWTSEADKIFYVSELKKADVIIMGSQTFTTFSKHPKNSTWIILTNHPENHPNLKSLELLPDFDRENPSSTSFYYTSLSPKQLIGILQQKHYQNIAICGGKNVYTQFIASNLVDEYLITVEESVVFGSGIPLFDNPKLIHDLKKATELRLSKTARLDKFCHINNQK